MKRAVAASEDNDIPAGSDSYYEEHKDEKEWQIAKLQHEIRKM